MEVDVSFIVCHEDFIRWDSGQEDETPCLTSYPYFRESFYAWSFPSFKAPILGQQYPIVRCLLVLTRKRAEHDGVIEVACVGRAAEDQKFCFSKLESSCLQ